MAEKKITTHRGHQPGFCDWLCLPKVLVQQFTNTSGWDVSTPALRADVEARVILWAEQERANWQGPVDESMWDFWKSRWRRLGCVYCDTGELVPHTPKVSLRPSSEAWRAKQDYPRENR